MPQKRPDPNVVLQALRSEIDAVHRALESSTTTDPAFDAGAVALDALWKRHCGGERPGLEEATRLADAERAPLQRRALVVLKVLEMEKRRQVREVGSTAYDKRFGPELAARDAANDAASVEDLRERLKRFERIHVLRADSATYGWSPLGESARELLIELEHWRDHDSRPPWKGDRDDESEDWTEDPDVPLSRWRDVLVEAWRGGVRDAAATDTSRHALFRSLRRTIYAIGTLYIDKDGETVRRRCCGWFPTFSEAEAAALNDTHLLFEDGYYNYVVIESVPEGIYQYGAAAWYRPASWEVRRLHNGRRRRCIASVERVERPESERGIVGGYFIG